MSHGARGSLAGVESRRKRRRSCDVGCWNLAQSASTPLLHRSSRKRTPGPQALLQLLQGKGTWVSRGADVLPLLHGPSNGAMNLQRSHEVGGAPAKSKAETKVSRPLLEGDMPSRRDSLLLRRRPNRKQRSPEVVMPLVQALLLRLGVRAEAGVCCNLRRRGKEVFPKGDDTALLPSIAPTSKPSTNALCVQAL